MKIEDLKWETGDVFSFSVEKENTGHSGQFYMLSVPGTGEAPISVASGKGRNLSFTIRKIGSVTAKIPMVSEIGVRGPYGKGWPWEDYDKILAIAGGIGIPPIKSLIEEMYDAGRKEDISLIYGARTPADLVYKEMLEKIKNEIDVTITVDKGDISWKGNVGFVTEFIKKNKISRKAAVFIIGPPLMMKNSVNEAMNAGFMEENIFLSLERRMECGIGVCGHCNIGEYYVCEDGPVFNYHSVKEKPELFL